MKFVCGKLCGFDLFIWSTITTYKINKKKESRIIFVGDMCVFCVYFLFAILSVGKMYRFSSFAHWLCIVYKYKKLWSAIHSVCIKSPCNTFQGILSHMKKPDSREVATRARMEDFFIVAFYIISFKKNQT